MKLTSSVFFRLIVGFLALVGGAFAAYYLSHSYGSQSDKHLTASFNDLSGKPQAISQWQGRILILNFWATWCEPCREEIPDFIKLQRVYDHKNVQFVGIAIDDREKIQEFVNKFSVNYPVLVGGLDAIELSKQLGNRSGGLPFTVAIDRTGNVVFSHLGRVSTLELDALIQKFL